MRNIRKQASILLCMACLTVVFGVFACSAPPEAGEVTLEAKDQKSNGKTLTIETLAVTKTAWLVATKQGASSAKDVYAIIKLNRAAQSNVTLNLGNPITATTRVVLAIYVDLDEDEKLDQKKDTLAKQVTIQVTIGEAPDPSVNSLNVDDQRGDGSTLTIASLNLVEEKGWLYITKSSVGSPNDIYATVEVNKGTKSDYQITLDNNIPTSGPVKVTLYVDDGDGKFDIKKDNIAKGKNKRSLSVTIDVVVGGPDANALVIEDQALLEGSTNTITIKTLQLLDKSGLIFIAKDKDGKPGQIIARSSQSKNTSKSNFTITLKEDITEAQTLHATLYEGPVWKSDSEILKDKAGKPIQFAFQVTIQAATQGATLEVEEQTLTEDFDTITVKQAALPITYIKNGYLHFFQFKNGKADTKVAEVKLAPRRKYTDLKVKIDHLIVNTEGFQVKMLDEAGKPFTDKDGNIVQTIFSVNGDTANATISAEAQQIADDLQTVKVAAAFIPQRFDKGGFIALYADENGQRGKLLQKKQIAKGEHKDVVLRISGTLKRKQLIHAVLHSGRSWLSSKPPPVIELISGGEVATVFEVDHPKFHPVVEIEDQFLANNKTVKLKTITVPRYVLGAYLGIFSDKNGQPDQLLAKRSYPRGTRTNQSIDLNLKQEGKKKLHAILYEGQTWDPNNAPILKDNSGQEVRLTFNIGANSLNYIITKPYIATSPRHIVLERAYSHKHMVWVVIARDNNGKPGTIIAKKRLPARDSRRVIFSHVTKDFETNGDIQSFLKGKPGTYRRSIRGEENVHVLLYADQPQDNKFTYQPGGTEDQPLKDADGNDVMARWNIMVKSSIQNTQKDSNRYYSPCHISHWRANPTANRADCRCSTVLISLRFPDCTPSIARFLQISYGKGPRVVELNFGGFVSGFGEKSTNELIAIAKWKDHKTKRPESGVTIDTGVVMAIHAETGDRRLIGGRHYDLKKGAYDIGTGPALSYPFRIRKGTDGKYYIANYSYIKGDKNTGVGLVPTIDIIRMDPKTGNREYVWRSNHLGHNFDKKPNPYGHCANGRTQQFGYSSVQISRKAFAMDNQNNFYLSAWDNGKTATSNGIGIIKVSADGKKCSFVTRTNTGKENLVYKGKDIGSGAKPQAGPYKGMLYKDGFLYATTFIGSETYKIDVNTGNREIIIKPGHTAGKGFSRGAVIKWDPYRNLIWQQGLDIATSYYDPSTKKVENLYCAFGEKFRRYKGIGCMIFRGTFILGNPAENGFWFHPNNKDYMFMQTGGAMVKVHLYSGTDIIHSY